MIFLTIIAFIVIFSVLILIHEWGHFAAARRAGIKVEEFGIGLPPRARKLFKDKKGTLYSLNYIPFGGFVRLYGEDSADPKVLKDSKSFAGKSIGKRSFVILAGVTMNFLLAWFLLSIGFTFGMQPLLANQQDFEKARAAGIVEAIDGLYVHEIAPDSPLKTTVLKVGDYITAVNGTPVTKAENLSPLLQPDTPVAIEYYHETKKNSLNVTSNSESKLGISISSAAVILKVHNVSKPFYKAPFYALSEVGRLSFLTVKMLGEVVVSIVAKFTVPEGVAGPVGIAKMTNYFVKQGFMALLQFTALISISLAVINVMPFPALDGGRFLFIIFEVIARRRPSPKWESAIHSIGFALLMLLIVIVTWNDIASLFT